MGRETIQRESFIVTRENPKVPEVKTMKIKNPVYLTADKSKAVPDGHPEAAFLLVGRNGIVTEEQVKLYKLTENGAPGQKGETAVVISPSMVNPWCPDGVNTAPGTPAATGLASKLEPKLSEPEIPVDGKKEEESEAPKSAPEEAPKRGPGRPKRGPGRR